MTAAVAAIARLTWKRVVRGRTIWVSGLLLLVPLVVAAMTLWRIEDPAERWSIVCELTFRSLVLLAPVLLLAPAIGEENQGKTYTYLWSRPVPRTALVLGKMAAVVPLIAVCAGAAVVTAYLIVSVGPGAVPGRWLARALVATVAGVAAASCFAVGMGALVPRHPLVGAVGYVFFGEQILPEIPSVQNIATLYHVESLARLPSPKMNAALAEPGRALVTLVVLSALWLAVALWRVRRFEFGSAEG